jgi:acetyl-CoA synthetase/medium-chain acyl-CoA synthetase
VKGLRIGRRRARSHDQPSSPVDLALRPALADGRWSVPDRFNFTRDVVEALASDPKRQALTFIGHDGVIEPRTFLQVAEAAAWWAAVLAEHGVQSKDRVLVLAESSLHWLELALGLMKIGAVIVPCRPSLSAAALEARVSSTDASLVVAEHGCRPAIEQMSFAPGVHYIDEAVRPSASDVPEDSRTHDTSTRDLAFIFTSAGATGAPKEIAHTHAAVFAARVQAEHWLDAGPRDVVWCTAQADSPLHAWFAFVGPWSRGAEIVLHGGDFDPHERLEHLYRLGPTIACQSANEYRALADLPRLERFRPPRLRRLVSTGDVLEPEVREAFEERWGLTVHDGYGQAETGIVIVSSADDPKVVGAIGRPLPGYEVAVIDDQGNRLPAGVEGDLAVRGNPPTLFAGYWEAPEETKQAFRGDWYVTGDVALVDEEDMFFFVGRAEDVITSSGRTFGPYGIEHVLRSHAAIAASAVVGIRDLQRGGHFVRAFVVPAARVQGSEQLEVELRQHVGEVLPDQQVPREIVFVDTLPLVGGKVSRSTLREQPLSGRPLWDVPPTAEPEAVPPATSEPARAVAPAPRAEAAPVVEPPRAPLPEPVPEPEPVAVVEPEPVVVVEPQPVMVEPEPEPVAAEPVAVVEPEAAAVEPVVPSEPEPAPVIPEPEPVSVVEQEPVAVVEQEPLAVIPEPEPVPVVEPEPVAVVEPETAPEPEAQRGPEFRVVPEPEPDPGPLPDFVVPPEPDAAKPPIVAPEPEPEPSPALEPLPDYIVDPSRSPEPRVDRDAQRQAAQADQPAFPGLMRPPEPEPSTAEAAGMYFPPVTSFPQLRDDDIGADGQREARKAPRRKPPTDGSKPKKKRSLEEPGDDAGDAGWMAGLSNRLSAYSLAEEDADEEETEHEDEGDRDDS